MNENIESRRKVSDFFDFCNGSGVGMNIGFWPLRSTFCSELKQIYAQKLKFYAKISVLVP